jgi:hypothetical protein
VFEVDGLLARWRKNQFLLRWQDGTYSWVHRKDINAQLVCDFEKTYEGLDEGVTVLEAKKQNHDLKFLLAWEGRPKTENSWVSQQLLSPRLRRSSLPSCARLTARGRSRGAATCVFRWHPPMSNRLPVLSASQPGNHSDCTSRPWLLPFLDSCQPGSRRAAGRPSSRRVTGRRACRCRRVQQQYGDWQTRVLVEVS